MTLRPHLILLTATLLTVSLPSVIADKVVYTYDNANRLVRVDYGGGSAISYAYDKNGNLVSRTPASAGPSITAAGVLNAASFQGGAVAPGEMITLFGDSIGPAVLALYQLTPDGLVGSSVSDTRVLFDNTPAPIYYVSSKQTTVIVPYGVAGKSATQMQVEYKGVRSAPVTLAVAAAAPGIFTSNQIGNGQGAIVNQDGTINSQSAPAPKTSVVLVYLTGDGQTDPPGTDGKLATTVFPKTAQAVTVSIGGVNADVLYAGVAPLSVAGFTQINARVPAGAPSGAAVSIVVTVGQANSLAGVTMAVQ
jgi:uncharacterized protein (TIGR03437 family)